MKVKSTSDSGAQGNEVGFNQDILNTLKSSVLKARKLVENILDTDQGFLEKIDNAGITPNNIVTIRLILLFVGFVLHTSGSHGAGIALLSLSCLGDSLDGQLARSKNKMSVEGEIYDAGTDKVSVNVMNILATAQLIPTQPLVGSVYGLTALYNGIGHYKSQFKESRPAPKIQGKMVYQSILQDERTKFITKTTSGAANHFGKIKALSQFLAPLGILIFSEYGEGSVSIFYALIALNVASIPLAHFSTKGTGEKEKKT